MIDGLSFSYEIALRWMSLDLTDEKSTMVQVMAWCHQATSHYLSQCWSRSMSPDGVTRPQWVNSPTPSDAIWRYRSGATLGQVMAYCSTAQSYSYLNQCWLVISEVLGHSPDGNFTGNAKIFIPDIAATSLRGRDLLAFITNKGTDCLIQSVAMEKIMSFPAKTHAIML